MSSFIDESNQPTKTTKEKKFQLEKKVSNKKKNIKSILCLLVWFIRIDFFSKERKYNRIKSGPQKKLNEEKFSNYIISIHTWFSSSSSSFFTIKEKNEFSKVKKNLGHSCVYSSFGDDDNDNDNVCLMSSWLVFFFVVRFWFFFTFKFQFIF